MVDSPELQIIISSGPQDVKSTLGFAAATAASSCGTRVVLFLVMEGARWALKSVGNEPQQPGYQPVAEMLEIVQEAGGRIEVCSNCLTDVCSTCTQDLCTALDAHATPQDLREGVHPGGLAAVAIRMSQIPTVAF